jgi:hypothetical protein
MNGMACLLRSLGHADGAHDTSDHMHAHGTNVRCVRDQTFPLDSDGHASRPRRRPGHAAVVSREGAAGTVVESSELAAAARTWEVVVAGAALPPGLCRGEFRS